MKRFLVAILFLPILQAHGQARADSLKKAIKSPVPYKERIKAYLDYLQGYNNTKNFDEIIELGNDAITLARKNADSVSVAVAQRCIGTAHYFKGQYDVAATFFYSSISLLEAAKEKGRLAESYNVLGKLYRKTRDLDRALVQYDKALAIFREIKDSAGIATILNESGVVFEYKEDYEEALRRYNASLKIQEALKDSVGISYALSFIAGVYNLQKKFDLAEKNMMLVIDIRKQLRDTFGLALVYADMGAIYNAKGDYRKAIEYLNTSNVITEKLQYPELLSSNYNELALIEEKQGNYSKALAHFRKKTELHDSLFRIDKTNQIEEMNARYEFVKKERLIQDQLFRIKQKNYFIGGAIGLLIFGALLGYLFYRRRQLKQETIMQSTLMKQQEEATKAVIEAEENERQRIAKDLHDGVGQMMSAAKMNLSAFESEIKFDNQGQQQSFEKIIALVDESCKEVRSVSHNMMPNALLKNNLASAVKEFVDKIDKKTLQVHLDTEGLNERLDSNTETVLYRVIQECVNNVIKHSGASTLDISLIKDKEGISATIEDNGKGFDTTDKEKFEGIGLKNIITRVEFLKGTVDFDSAPGKGTLVALHVPLN